LEPVASSIRCKTSVKIIPKYVSRSKAA
jgi:hypothetical protein